MKGEIVFITNASNGIGEVCSRHPEVFSLRPLRIFLSVFFQNSTDRLHIFGNL